MEKAAKLQPDLFAKFALREAPQSHDNADGAEEDDEEKDGAQESSDEGEDLDCMLKDTGSVRHAPAPKAGLGSLSAAEQPAPKKRKGGKSAKQPLEEDLEEVQDSKISDDLSSTDPPMSEVAR